MKNALALIAIGFTILLWFLPAIMIINGCYEAIYLYIPTTISTGTLGYILGKTYTNDEQE
jgi:hypothetical protein